jgi:hypothetical protein
MGLKKGLPERAVRTGLPGQDCQDRTARNRTARNRTARTGLPGPGLPRQGCFERTDRTDSKGRAKRTGQTE